jgi:hypothetical protein
MMKKINELYIATLMHINMLHVFNSMNRIVDPYYLRHKSDDVQSNGLMTDNDECRYPPSWDVIHRNISRITMIDVIRPRPCSGL